MDAVDRTPELRSLVNPENRASAWIPVSDDLVEAAVTVLSGYFNSRVDNTSRPQYDPMELQVYEVHKIKPSIQDQDLEQLQAKAFADEQGNVEKLMVELKGSSASVTVSGKALEDTARRYFHEKEQEK